MNGKFKKIFVPALSLFCICLVSALLLALTNELTHQKIEDAAKAEEIAQRAVVCPEGTRFEETENYALAYDSSNAVVGYIFVTTGKGYGGTISVMTGIDANGVITGVKVLSHSETSSYGGKAIKNDFTDEYRGKAVQVFVKGKNIDGWTGATRTTNGVAQAVNAACDIYSDIINAQKGGE